MDQKTYEVGQELPPYKVIITKKTYRKYNFLIREINPIHFNTKYAQKMGYEDVIVAGNFLYSYIPKWILDWIGDIKAINKISVKFGNPVYLEDELIHNGKIIEVKNENGKKVVVCEFQVIKVNGEFALGGTIQLLFSD